MTNQIEKKEILTGTQIVYNYPYGRLQCEMRFSIEYVKGKGFRNVMQSINPKTGRLNAPKKSTYSPLMYMYKESGSGHIKFAGMQLNSYGSIQALINAMINYDLEFTSEQSKDLWITCINCIRGNAQFTRLKEGVTIEQLLETTKVKEMIRLYGASANISELKNISYNLQSILDLEAIR